MKPLPKAKIDIFFSNSVSIFLTRFFPVLAVLLVQIYYSRHLPKEVYGTYQNFWVQLYIFAAIGCAGIHMFLITYPADFLIRLLYTLKASFYFYFLLWLSATCICFSWLQSAHGYNPVVPFLFLFTHVVSAIIEAFLITSRRFRFLVVVNLVYSGAFCWLHYMLLEEDLSLATLLFYILLLMLAKVILCKTAAVLYFQKNKRAALQQEAIITGIRRLWLHLGLYDMLQIFTRWIDKFVIGFLFSASVAGVYFNGSVDIPFLAVILGAAGSAVLIQLAGSSKQGEPQHTLRLIHRSSRFLSAIVFPLFLFFILFRYELFEVVFTGKFEAAVPVFLASSLAIPLRAYAFTTVLQNRNMGAVINTGAILDIILALLLIYPLYMLCGLPGIALSFTLATYAQACYYLHRTSRVLNVSIAALIPYKNWLGKLAVLCLAFFVLYYLCSSYLSPANSLFTGIIFTATIIALAIRLELRNAAREDNQAITREQS